MTRRVSNARSKRRLEAKAKGFASGFELDVAEYLAAQGQEYQYELESYKWSDKIPNASCVDCGGKAEAIRSYTPDFFLTNGRIIECKGNLTAKDRKIAYGMQEIGVVISYLFDKDNKLSPKSKTRYSEWCGRHGFEYAIKTIPLEWLGE